MNKNRRRARAARLNRHHIIPVSRCKEFGINPDFPGNVTLIKRNRHKAWHTLFGNATPDEAIEIIRRDWMLKDNVVLMIRRRKG